MTQYRIEFGYTIPEESSIVLDLEESMDQVEKEEEILQAIKEEFPDISNIEIFEVKAI